MSTSYPYHRTYTHMNLYCCYSFIINKTNKKLFRHLTVRSQYRNDPSLGTTLHTQQPTQSLPFFF